MPGREKPLTAYNDAVRVSLCKASIRKTADLLLLVLVLESRFEFTTTIFCELGAESAEGSTRLKQHTFLFRGAYSEGQGYLDSETALIIIFLKSNMVRQMCNVADAILGGESVHSQ
jgi:hypothetical protein